MRQPFNSSKTINHIYMNFHRAFIKLSFKREKKYSICKVINWSDNSISCNYINGLICQIKKKI